MKQIIFTIIGFATTLHLSAQQIADRLIVKSKTAITFPEKD